MDVRLTIAAVLLLLVGSESSATHAERLSVDWNHCFLEPVPFDGRLWNVPFDRQFGWGGLEPRAWQGTGVMTRVAEDRAIFRDDGGASVTFLPAEDPSVRAVERAVCA